MTNKKMEEKAAAVLVQLTLEEKIGMIHGSQLFQTAGVPRLGIKPLVMSDGPMGVRQEFKPDRWEASGTNTDYVTYLPCNSALAATFNRRLAYEAGSVLGEEARGRGKDVILAPGINIKRSPLCGRNFEYFSEDPYLAGELAAAYIQGVQLWDVAACVKHFAVNNQETQRLWVEVDVDEAVLREIYFPAFEKAVKKGGAYTVMGAYNKLYGSHCCQSEFLLDTVLRKEWGFDGVVISDWGGVHDTQEAARSGLDIEMSVTNDFDDYFMAQPLKQKIESGEISEHVIDEKVKRILKLMFRLHMLGEEPRKRGAYNTIEHHQKVLDAARESVVLLKNDRRILPLSEDRWKRILVIGENADRLHADGGGSAEIKALYEISPLMGLRSRLGGDAEITYAQGYCSRLASDVGSAWETNWQEHSLEGGGSQDAGAVGKERESAALAQKREVLRREALQLAADYDTVIYIGGLNHDLGNDCEGGDRSSMKLPYGQDMLIQDLLKIKKDMIIVLAAGSPVDMQAWIGQADTVVWCWYAGMEGGSALADILLGRISPSGKLPETFFKTLSDCPAHSLGEFPGTDHAAYREGSYVGYRYADQYDIEPAFCFGHGLSYTEFTYSDARIDRKKKEISCMVANTGAYDGSEAVQLYKMDKDSGFVKQLAGFEKVYLKKGGKQRVVIPLEELDVQVQYCLGSSSRDIRLAIWCE